MSDVEDLLWQVLVFQLRVFDEVNGIEAERGRDETKPLIGALNQIDEHVFGALFELVPGMYDESDEDGKAREEGARERFGDLPASLGLTGTAAERLERLLGEVRRRIGAATVRLDASEGEEGEFEALDEFEAALDGVASALGILGRITQGSRA